MVCLSTSFANSTCVSPLRIRKNLMLSVMFSTPLIGMLIYYNKTL
nr:MAG TPA: hypothetical protein [Caudoviricetes sp.]